jgi:hypothetical protein
MPLLAGLGAALGGMIGGSGGGGGAALREAVDAWKKLKTSDFDFSRLTAPELEAVFEIAPALRNVYRPEEAPEIADSPEMRQALTRQLAGLEQVAAEGMPLVDRLQQQRVQESILGSQQRGTQNVLRDLAARGQLTGGTGVQARLAAGQGAMNVASDMGAQLAQQAALRRLGAGGQAAELAGQIRGQDIGLGAARSGQAERFNALTAAILNQGAQDQAMAQERAQQMNALNKQRIADQNAMLKLQQENLNVNRFNQLKQQQFGQQYAQTGGLTGALGKLAGLQEQQRARQARVGGELGGVVGEFGDQVVSGLLAGAGAV